MTEADQLRDLFGHASEPNLSLAATAAHYLEARRQRVAADDAARQCRQRQSETEKDLQKAMSTAFVSGTEIDGVSLVKAESRHYRARPGSITNTFFLCWLSWHGASDLIERRINERGLSHLCHSLVEKGEDLPYLIEEYVKTSIQVRRKNSLDKDEVSE